MSRRCKILHLVDDTTPGGVMRVVDFICSDAELAKTADHQMTTVRRGKIIGHLGRADVIVSHLAVSWRSLPVFAVLRADHASTPLVHVEHSYTESFMAHNVPNAWRFKALLKLAYSFFDRVVCVSNGQANWMISSHLLGSAKLFTIQSCVDLSAFRALAVPAGPVRTFAAIGRLDRQKGFDTLIDAFRLCTDPNIKLHVIGAGEQEPKLKALAGADTRIVFQGFQSDPVAALVDVDVVVMPSRWEAYGLVAIEALAAGRKLLCHDIDGLSDHARHGGVMLEAADTERLAKTIASEAHSKSHVGEALMVRDTPLLESQFRASWRFMLRQLCI